MRLAIVAIVLLAATVQAAELPPHARAAWGGWYECEPGYLMRGSACVDAYTASLEPRVEVSALPSAGDGASHDSPGAPSVVFSDRYVSRYSRYGGPYPDVIYDRIQSRLSPGARVVPFTRGY